MTTHENGDQTVNENDDLAPETITIPIPQLAPFGLAMSAESVQEVWDAFVKPDQDAGMSQSIEMRGLMGILRAVHKGMSDAEAAR